jgi:hypothetical protein
MIKELKILVCGSGPSLPLQLKGVDLSDFFVVRVNPWYEIDGYDNKCDAWAFYPYSDFGFGWYLERAKYLWMPHFSMYSDCVCVTGRKPDYIISLQDTFDFHCIINHKNPTSGAVVIYMATLLNKDVYIAGFDFSTKGKQYYYNDIKVKTESINHHKQWIEEKWVNGLIDSGKLFKLGAN